MALTDFEKDCIDEILVAITPKDSHRRTDSQQADFDTITQGTEVERQTLITSYINDTGLTKVATDITTCDDRVADLTAQKSALQTKQTTMQNYVA